MGLLSGFVAIWDKCKKGASSDLEVGSDLVGENLLCKTGSGWAS